jgi:segregation and condensation protein A
MSDGIINPIPFDDAFYRVELPAFEGPLDLLLHLIQKHELDVMDIPISFVTEKYLDYIRMMQSLNLDVAAEYLLMAATLAHIKSRMLLPNQPAEEAQGEGVTEIEEDPRAALVRRLLEYQKFKVAAEALASRGVAGRDVFPRGVDVRDEAVNTAPLAPVGLFALMEALQRIAAKKKLSLAHEVTAERVSISQRITELVDMLRARKQATFEELFENDRSTIDLVVTFLALLEMTRLNMSRLYQATPLDTIHITLLVSDDDPMPTIEHAP